MGLIEPVFGNIRHALGLDRFTLRGKEKVNIQWKLYNDGAQSVEDLPLWMDHSDGAERTEGDGGVGKLYPRYPQENMAINGRRDWKLC
jgi:hypothetical protein